MELSDMRRMADGPRLGPHAQKEATMSWLWAIIVGFVLGLIAKAILPGKQQIPLWLTTVFGILGSVLGNAVATWIGVEDTKGIDWTRHLLQLIGAVAVVGVGDMIWDSIKGNRQRA
ncbi:Putative integral membrane protein [Streptomyces venezuelae]|nr:Putative integral membrane protein [Streptomyces venezuelae]